MMTDLNLLLQSVSYKASRSSGSGGQNVNKVSTRVELLFDVAACDLLDFQEKEMILRKLKNRVNTAGVLRLVSQKERTQQANKKVVTEKFLKLIENCLKPDKQRKPTVVPDAVKELRIKEKKIKSDLKAARRKVQE